MAAGLRRVMTQEEVQARYTRAKEGLSTGLYRVEAVAGSNLFWVIRYTAPKSGKEARRYRVEYHRKLKRGRCFCDDYMNRQGPCKHLLMVGLVIREADAFWKSEAEAAQAA